MKMHPVLKEPGMKFPKLSNAFLDIGIILLLGGGVAICGVALGAISTEPYGFDLAVLALVLGFALYSVAKLLSKFRKPPGAGEIGFVPPKVGLKLVD